MSSRITESDNTKVPSLPGIISALKAISQIKPDIASYVESLISELKELTQDYYASFIILSTTPLSFHQRLVLMHLITIYPRGCSGIDLARALDISVQSKSIYRDLSMLQKENLVYLDEIHSRLRLAYANKDNRMINQLIELYQVHGEEKLKNSIINGV